MKISIEKPDPKTLEEKDVFSWPIWEKGVSRFDWYYDFAEECYLLEGKVEVEMPDGRKVEFGAGDYVKFPKGLSCVWDVKEPVKKHYTFK